MSEKKLCSRDLSILDLLFDQQQCEKTLKEATQPVQDEVGVVDAEEGNSASVQTSKKLEVEGVHLTEAGKLEEALEKFNESIRVAPERPSPFNNRAQLYRFMEKDDRE